MLLVSLPQGSLGCPRVPLLWGSEEVRKKTGKRPSLHSQVASLHMKYELVSHHHGEVENFLHVLTEESARSCLPSPLIELQASGGRGPNAWSWPPCPSGQTVLSSCGFPLGSFSLLSLFSPPLLSLASSRLKTFLMQKIIILFWNCK